MEENRNEAAMSVITPGMKINGDIISNQGLEVMGTVNGNIKIEGPLIISGTIQGDMEAGDVTGNAATTVGNIISSGTVRIGRETVIIGDITGQSAVISGAIKGNIDVKGSVILDSSAIVMGDIRSASVEINNGAVIEGHCSQCYSGTSPKEFFKNLVKGK